MPLERFTGPEISPLLALARQELGEDAIVLAVRALTPEEGGGYELTASDEAADASPGGAAAPRRARAWSMLPPVPTVPHGRLFVALVGPTGGGKTTTLAKLANHPRVFGGWPVGLLCLDTYRIGAVEQLRAYSEISELPFEVAYQPREARAAVRRLRGREVVLVDTAGRGPGQPHDLAETLAVLASIGRLETHLVLPAGLRLEHARRIVVQHRALGITHLLPTKLDECPDDPNARTLSRELGLPMRWYADGQEVPDDLGSAEKWRDAPDGAAHAALNGAASPALAAA